MIDAIGPGRIARTDRVLPNQPTRADGISTLTSISVHQKGWGRQSIARVQVTAMEARDLPEPAQIVNIDSALQQGEQVSFPQLT